MINLTITWNDPENDSASDEADCAIIMGELIHEIKATEPAIQGSKQ